MEKIRELRFSAPFFISLSAAVLSQGLCSATSSGHRPDILRSGHLRPHLLSSHRILRRFTYVRPPKSSSVRLARAEQFAFFRHQAGGTTGTVW